MNRQRLVLQVFQLRIHPDASRESGGWFHQPLVWELQRRKDVDPRNKSGDDGGGVIPGRSAAKGKGIHPAGSMLWIPFPVPRTAGDDRGYVTRE